MKTYFDIPYVENASEMQLLDMYLPDTEDFDTIVWFHGGGIEGGSRKSDVYARAFAEKGIGFVSVEYRMYPAAHFPEFIEDAASSVAYTIHNIQQYGGNGKVYVMGESAGAYITMMLCMDHHYLLDKGIRQEQIAGYISDSAQQFCHFNVLRELGLDRRLERIDEHAPIYFIKEDLQIRPLLMVYYTNDRKCRPEENRLTYASFQHVMPESKVDITELPGKHCSKPRREDGELMLVVRTCEFINSLG